MQKVVCQISRMAEYVGKQYADDILHPVRFWSVQSVETFLSHETTGAEEPPDSKLKNTIWEII